MNCDHKARALKLLPVAVVACLIALAAVLPASATPQETVRLFSWPGRGGVQTARAGEPLVAAADRVLVGLPGRVSPQAVRMQSEGIASAVNGRVSRILAGGRMAVIELPEDADLLSSARSLLKTRATFVQPDLVVHTAREPNDPRYTEQHHLPQINAPGAWDIQTPANDVVIAVVDSGVDLNHPDLADNLWVNTDEVPNNSLDDDRNGFVDDYRGWDFDGDNNDPSPSPDGKDNDNDGTADEEVSHGTLVAGIAAAVGNEGYGTAGVTWGARIMPVQVFPDDGSSFVSTVVEGIDYAVDNGADIINLSIGSSYDTGFSPPIERAYEAGICVISAAGNGGDEFTTSQTTWRSPVCNDGPNALTDNYVLGVTSVDQDDRVAWFSNFDSSGGNFVDVSAPGAAIFGPVYQEPGAPGFSDYFGTNDGTSFSCPMASGLAALIRARNPGYSPAQVYEAIRTGTDNVDPLNPGYEGKLGAGRLNCGRALGQQVPPAAVTNFQAVDTPGDNGGSITLSWTQSADDGGGSDSVTGYIVLRAEGSPENFQQIATLPPGTTTYEDTDVSAGTTYYYIIRTTDGEQYSDTEHSEGVSPINDAAPPVVTDLDATDVPDDDGGFIALDWSGYTAPADFAGYRIYRSSTDFSSTSDLTPIKTINSAGTQTWTDTTEDGVDYYYAVGVRDIEGNENRNIRATGPVQSYPNNAVTVGPGLLFMGPAAVPADRDPATLFFVPPENLEMAKWDPGNDGYVTYSAGQIPELLKLSLGQGFWVLLDQARTIEATGATAPSGDFSISLGPGWHQLANPFFGPFDFGESTVTYQNNVMDLASAENSGVMRSFAWIYSAAEDDYRLAYPDIGQDSTLIPPWTGFWVRVIEPCTLTLARPSGTASAKLAGLSAHRPTQTTTQAPWEGGWNTRVVLQTAGGVRTSSVIGTATEDYTIPTPPPVNTRPTIQLSGANRPLGESDCGVSLGSRNDDSWTWELQVGNLPEGTDAQIMLPDLSGMPNDLTAMLHDPATNRSCYVRTVSSYRFTGRGQPRTMQIVVGPRDTASLSINTLSVQQTRGSGVNIAFSLSAPARTCVEVMNIAGRSVAVVEQEHLRLAGNHNILFDGRNSHGASLPSGRYLVKIKAKSDSGQQVQRLMAVNYNK